MIEENGSSSKEVIVHIPPLTEQECLFPARGAAILAREEVAETVPLHRFTRLFMKCGDSVTAARQGNPKMLPNGKHVPLPVRRALTRSEAGG